MTLHQMHDAQLMYRYRSRGKPVMGPDAHLSRDEDGDVGSCLALAGLHLNDGAEPVLDSLSPLASVEFGVACLACCSRNWIILAYKCGESTFGPVTGEKYLTRPHVVCLKKNWD